MFRNVPLGKTITPGYTVIYPNREKASNKTTKAIVVLIMLVSVALMLVVTIGGWSKLQGMKPVNLVWCAVYLIMAFYIARWSRGLLPIVAALAVLLLITTLIAGTGAAGTSWFDRSSFGFAGAQSLFGGAGLSPDTLGLFTILIAPVQLLLIIVAMYAFGQSWNVELEVPLDEARRRGYDISGLPPAAPAPA
jgi:hypothetical protein